MSGRIRTIKPELLEDAITAGLSDVAFRLFIASITLADDYGNLRFESAWLRGQVYWARPVDIDAFAEAIEELTVAREGATEPLISAYLVKGQRYGAIRGWSKHQKVQHPGRPRVPGPPPSSGSSPALPEPPDSRQNTLSGDSHESLTPDHRSPITDPEGISDHEWDPPAQARAHTREGADAGSEIETLPPSEVPPDLDCPIPASWLARGEAIAKAACIALDVASSWRCYVAWCLGPKVREPASLPRWIRWVEGDVGKAAQRNGRLDDVGWGKVRANTLHGIHGGVAAPYHVSSGAVGRQRKWEAETTPENRAMTLELSAALATHIEPVKKVAP